MIARALWAMAVLGCSQPEAAPDGPVDGAIAVDAAIATDAPVEPDAACQMQSKLGPHLLGNPNDSGARTLLSACPRVAKWLAGAGVADSIAQTRASCPGLVVVLRVYVPPSVQYATSDDAALSADDFFEQMQPDLTTVPQSAVDWLEGPNELDNLPDWYHDPAAADWLARFWDRLADRMNGAGWHPLVGSIAVGNPALAGEDGFGPRGALGALADVLRAKTYPIGWSYHAYQDDLGGDPQWTLLRYRMLGDQAGLGGLPLVLSEGGQDGDRRGWRNPDRSTTAAEYLAFLFELDRQLLRDSDVVGVTLFQVGDHSSWDDFDLGPIAADLAAHIAAPQPCP